MIDPYSILGISRDASDEEVKKAYRKMSRKYHQDANIDGQQRIPILTIRIKNRLRRNSSRFSRLMSRL